MGLLSRRRALVALIVVVLLLAAVPGLADDYDDNGPPSGAAMIFDAMVIRPLGFATTVAGTGLFIASLPIALLSRSVDKAGQRMVAEPARYTFTRPLGNFDADTPAGEKH